MSSVGSTIRNFQRLHAVDENYATRPYGCVIVSSNPETDEVTYDGPRAGRTIPVAHPYLGPTSWIRVMPEQATRFVLDSRADGGVFTSAYIAEEASGSQIRATYDDHRFYYRRLSEGEIDITSKGVAGAHFSKDGTLSLRGGPMTAVLDVPRLEYNVKAPTVIHRVRNNDVTQLSSEHRLGVVKRKAQSSSGSGVTTDNWVKVSSDSGDSEFGMEHLLVLTSVGTPERLIFHREGHVVDEDGTEPTSSITGKKLRRLTEYGTINDEVTSVEVDVEGNYAVLVPDQAETGYTLQVTKADIRFTGGRDEVHTIDRHYLVDAEETIELEATKIKAGKDADEPMMRGEKMRTWLRNMVVLTSTGPAQILTTQVETDFTEVLSTKAYVE